MCQKKQEQKHYMLYDFISIKIDLKSIYVYRSLNNGSPLAGGVEESGDWFNGRRHEGASEELVMFYFFDLGVMSMVLAFQKPYRALHL